MQRAGELGHVVDVGGLAGHVQVRRLVRAADAHARAVAQRSASAIVVDARARVAQVVGAGEAGFEQEGFG